ncbi:hypothetical protein GIB67_011341, partial [Kingdonia uniflora]
DLMMSSAEEEYDGTDDELEFESDEDEGYVSQMQFLSGKKRKITYEELNCYEYCQIGHYILIDNRLDDFWPRMSGWHIKRRKLTENKAKRHLALMRQQLDMRTMNNMQWDPFRNIKDALNWEVIIVGNISRKRVLLQSPFGGYEWYLGDRCWAQLEHRAVPYDPPEKLHCFPSSDVACLTYMSDITRCGNIDIPGLGALTAGVTFPHVEFPTGDFSTQETQIPPPELGDYLGWIMEFGSPHGTTWHTIPFIVTTSTVDVPIGYDFFAMTKGMRKLTLDRTLDLEARHLHDESRIIHLTADLKHAEGRLFQFNDYLDGEGIVVDWEDDEGKAGTSQAGTSRGRRSRGRTSEGGAAPPQQSRFLDVLIKSSSEEEEEENIDESSIDYSDDDVIDAIKMEILSNQAEINELQEAESSGSRVGSPDGRKPFDHWKDYQREKVAIKRLCLQQTKLDFGKMIKEALRCGAEEALRLVMGIYMREGN